MNGRNVAFLEVVRCNLLTSLSLLLYGWGGWMTPAQGATVAFQDSAASPVPLTMASQVESQAQSTDAAPAPTASPTTLSLKGTAQAQPTDTAPASTATVLVNQPFTTQPHFSESCGSSSLPQTSDQACPTPEARLLAQTADPASEPLESPSGSNPFNSPAVPETPLDLPPEVIESSPVLQEWLQRTPNVTDEIANDPSFRPRLRLGYSQFPSSGNISGANVGVEDVFIWPGTGLTLSGNYARSWNSDRETYGAQARFYLFPLGGYVNFAPVLGYRQLSTSGYTTSGIDVGMRLMVIPSRGGGADVALSQTWVAPGTQDEVGMTGASIGYAVTSKLRLSTDLQFQNSRFGQDSRLGINLEWLL
ncbi:MAG TPA: hypothetical protein V6D29_02555 [Leptolyngbyaceae cyanobacterium]